MGPLIFGIIILLLSISERIFAEQLYGKPAHGAGIIGIMLGICLIIQGVSNLKKSEFKCKKCLSLYYKQNFENAICPSCNIKLEPLEGFFDRHPELRDAENESTKPEKI